jgi:hypothetical protein
MLTLKHSSISSSFCISCFLLVALIFITLPAEQFSDAQVTITLGVDDETHEGMWRTLNIMPMSKITESSVVLKFNSK